MCTKYKPIAVTLAREQYHAEEWMEAEGAAVQGIHMKKGKVGKTESRILNLISTYWY